MRRHPSSEHESVRTSRTRNDRHGGGGRKTAPPEQTNAENFYYQKQMQSKTPMVIVLRDGEEIHGMIEWYDKSCLKVTRNGQTNLLIYKPRSSTCIKKGRIAGSRRRASDFGPRHILQQRGSILQQLTES